MNNVKIGNLVINSQVSLAPMAGITDYVLRSLVREYSKTCLLTTEMISSEALINESKCKKRDMIASNNLLKKDDNHSPVAYQITGHKPELMADAVKIIEPMADIIDINMGCPVNKVVKGQDGCALMRNPKLAMKIVSTIKSVISKPLSVKFRLGYTQDEMNFKDYGKMMQDAGADFITIHARTRSQMYAGKADWAKIRELKNNVSIPVFANGDITSVESAVECLEISGADGVAIGRGALGDVSLLHQIEHYLQTGEKLPPLSLEEKIKILKKLIDMEVELRGEDVGIKFVRKYYPYYVSGIQNAAKYRSELVLESDYNVIMKKLDMISEQYSTLAV